MADENTQATEGTENAQSVAAAQTGQPRTFTQEEVNKLVGDARVKERKKYEGYVDGAELDDLREQAKTAMEELEQLKAKAARESAVAKVAEKHGVASDVVAMLSGADEDELDAQMRKLMKLMPVHPARTDDGGASVTAKKTKADKFAEALFG